jgi:hypothetical protein
MKQGTTAKAAVRFVSYDTIRNSLKDDNGILSPGRGMLAGMFAGAVESVLAVTPTERIKTALSVAPIVDDWEILTSKLTFKIELTTRKELVSLNRVSMRPKYWSRDMVSRSFIEGSCPLR